MYLNNVYTDEQKIRNSDNITDHKKDVIEVYDQVRKIFIIPRSIPNIYVPTYNKSDDGEKPDTTNMSDLETEESAAEGKRLKISTPQQMLSSLPISLAQLKAGNNSEKLINEIRQLLYSLYS